MKNSKKRVDWLFLVILSVFLLPRESPAAVSSPYADRQIIVKLKENSRLDALAALNQKYQVISIVNVFPQKPLPEDNLKKLYLKLSSLYLRSKFKKANVDQEKKVLEKQVIWQKQLVSRLQKRQVRAYPGVSQPKLDKVYSLTTGRDVDVLAMVNEYSQNPAVLYAEPNYISQVQSFPQTLPNDTYADPNQDNVWSNGAWSNARSDLWGLEDVEANKAWPLALGNGIVVAVVDSGIDYSHPDIVDNLWENAGEIPGDGIDNDSNGYVDDVMGFDFANSKDLNGDGDYNDDGEISVADPLDDLGHGTIVAGIIAAVGNNAEGIIGVAPKSKIMPIKAILGNGVGAITNVGRAIRYAADNGADIINGSLGYDGSSSLMTDAVNYAQSKGCLIVAAAGNHDSNVSNFTPANISGVIAVAAVDQMGDKRSDSNWGYRIDVAAPGEGILSLLTKVPNFRIDQNLVVGRNYYLSAGTSDTAPFVSGLAALLLERFPQVDNKEIRARILAGTTQFNNDYVGFLGTRKINAYKSLTLERSPYFRIRDTKIAEKDGDGDGVVISGETMQLVISLEGVWMDTAGIIATLSSDSPYVESIIKKNCFFGDITQLEIKDNSADPFLVKLKDVRFEAALPFKIKIESGGFSQELTFEVYPGRVKALVEHPADVKAYAVSGSKVVWIDTQRGIYQPWLYDFTTGEQKKLLVSEGAGFVYPTISNDLVAYVYNGRIVIQDAVTGKWNIPYIKSTNISDLCLDSGRLVRQGGDKNIYFYDLATNSELQITNDAFEQSKSVVSGDKIVWQDKRNGNFDIYLYDLAKKEERRITSDPSEQIEPRIYKNKIVWSDKRNGNWDIYLYDLETGKEENISSDSRDDRYPYISEDTIVWETRIRDYPMDSDHNIYLYNMVSGKKIQITSNPAFQSYPIVEGDRVFWLDYRQGSMDIFMFGHNPEIYFAPLGDILLDKTPPIQVNVTDDGQFTNSQYWHPKASWSISEDKESGFVGYEYCLGTQPGLTDVFSWRQTMDTNTPVLNLYPEHGVTYYFAVKSINGVGLESISVSDGITADFAAPVIRNLTPDFQTRGRPSLFKVKAEDNVSGVAEIILNYSDSTGAKSTNLLYKPETGLYEAEVTIASNSNWHYYSFTYKDNAGNQASTGFYLRLVLPADINKDGKVDATDVQLVINASLGRNIGSYNADINNDGKVNATDVQLVINASLGKPISKRPIKKSP